MDREVLEAEERLDDDPNDVDALRRLAAALVAEEDFEIAHEVYLDLVRLRPESAPALHGLALTSRILGDLPLAAESEREALRLERG